MKICEVTEHNEIIARAGLTHHDPDVIDHIQCYGEPSLFRQL